MSRSTKTWFARSLWWLFSFCGPNTNAYANGTLGRSTDVRGTVSASSFLVPLHTTVTTTTTSSFQHTSNSEPHQLGNGGDVATRNHQGDPIFSQMMNDLIANGRTPSNTYQQIRLPSNRRICVMANGLELTIGYVSELEHDRVL